MSSARANGSPSAEPPNIGGSGADRAVGRAFATLGLGEALARLVSFTATVWIARRLGADAYGIVSVALAIVGYFTLIADYSIEVMGARELAHDRTSVDRITGPLVVQRLLIAATCIVLIAGTGLLILPQPDGAILAACAFSLLATASSTRFVFVGLERPGATATARVGGELVGLLAVMLLARDAADLGNVPATRVLGDGIAVVAMVLVLRRRGFTLPARYDPSLARPVLAKAAPLVGHAVLGLLIFNSDLIFLRFLRDEQTAGHYAAAYALVSFLLNIGVAYGVSLLPVFTRLAGDPPKQRQLYDDAMTQLLTVALPVAVGGFLVAGGLIGSVFGEGYAASTTPLRILIWSVLAAGVRTVGTYSLIALGQQSFVLKTTAWSAAINLVLNFVLIPAWGMPGAAVATLATEALRTVIGLAYATRFGLRFGWVRRLWRPLLCAAVMALVLEFVTAPHVALAIVMGAATYGITLMLVGGLRFAAGKPALTV